MKGYKRVRIFPERDLRATRLELAVIDTKVFQRLRHIAQLGQSSTVFPTAEHSRFAHSLGTLYWVSKMLAALRENYNLTGNLRILADAEAVLFNTVLKGYPTGQIGASGVTPDENLEITWFEQLIRLHALTHDMSHIPFGHTLEDQAGCLPRHDEEPSRLTLVFSLLEEQLEASPHLADPQGQDRLRQMLKRLLEVCKALNYISLLQKDRSRRPHDFDTNEDWLQMRAVLEAFRSFIPFATLAFDLVGNTICADLIDYVQRDSNCCGMPWTLDKILFSSLCIVEKKSAVPDFFAGKTYHLAVDASRKDKLRHDVLTAILGILRARYDLTEKVYYHHTKCAADAMLEKVIRTCGIELNAEELIRSGCGDEGLYYRLQEFCKVADDRHPLNALLSRRLYKAVYCLRDSVGWGVKTRMNRDALFDKDNRTKLENMLANQCKLPSESAIIVSCLPQKMQLKQADALVQWTDGELLTLKELPDKKQYLHEVKHLTDRYRSLWSLTVYVRTDLARLSWSIVENACSKHFDWPNDPLLHRYLLKRYPEVASIREELDDVLSTAEAEAVQAYAVALGQDGEHDRNFRETIWDRASKLIQAKQGIERPTKIQGVSRSARRRSEPTGPEEPQKDIETILNKLSEIDTAADRDSENNNSGE